MDFVKGSKTCYYSSSTMPMPWSATVTCSIGVLPQKSPKFTSAMTLMIPLFWNFTAFESKFSNTY